jgi:hypothetical protein
MAIDFIDLKLTFPITIDLLIIDFITLELVTLDLVTLDLSDDIK